MVVFHYQDKVIALRNPTRQGNLALETKLLAYRTMDGSAITYVDKPSTFRHQLNWEFIERSKIIELKLFLLDVAGKYITYVDHQGTSWLGHITTDPAEIVQDQPNGSCTVTLEFEGNEA